MSDSQKALLAFLERRQLSLDPAALRVMHDKHLVRVWNSEGELIHYNKELLKLTSYNQLDLCYYDLKTLWRFENDGFDIFKALVARALLGQDLAKERSYSVRENSGKEFGAIHTVDLAVPLFQEGQIRGILIAGTSELKKPA